MITEKKVIEIVDAHLKGTSRFLVEVAVKSGNRIALFIDGDQGILVGDCQELTRHIESKLDRDAEDYELTVSSAGADRPLMLPRQYRRHTGRELEVHTKDGKSLSGKLVSAGDEGIELETVPSKKEKKTERYNINYQEIKEARVKLSFKK
jgi:ribosome maturation factor RimP